MRGRSTTGKSPEKSGLRSACEMADFSIQDLQKLMFVNTPGSLVLMQFDSQLTTPARTQKSSTLHIRGSPLLPWGREERWLGHARGKGRDSSNSAKSSGVRACPDTPGFTQGPRSYETWRKHTGEWKGSERCL